MKSKKAIIEKSISRKVKSHALNHLLDSLLMREVLAGDVAEDKITLWRCDGEMGVLFPICILSFDGNNVKGITIRLNDFGRLIVGAILLAAIYLNVYLLMVIVNWNLYPLWLLCMFLFLLVFWVFRRLYKIARAEFDHEIRKMIQE